MGIIYPETISMRNGVVKAGTYMSFANETIYIRQGNMLSPTDRMYHVNANYNIYWDKDTRFRGLPHIQQESIQASLSNMNVNIYDQLYAVLKNTYPNSEDCLDNTFVSSELVPESNISVP